MQRTMTWVALGALLGLGIGCDSGGTGETSMDTGAGMDAVAESDTTTPGCEPTDPCCDPEGAFLPAGETCVLSEESVCSSDGCGGAPVSRQIFGQCSGDQGTCGGIPAHGPWTSLEVCGWDAVCDPETLTCIAGACEVETCGDPDVDEFDKDGPNEVPADAATVLDDNPSRVPCDPDLSWTGTLHDAEDWDWYRFNVDEYEGHDCATLDPVFSFNGVPGAWIQFRCWTDGEVAEFDESEGVFDCDLVPPFSIADVELGQALACRIGPEASFTNLRCWRADYGDKYNTAMMIIIGVGDDADHPCANYSVTVSGAAR
jgi:hypothetical protein